MKEGFGEMWSGLGQLGKAGVAIGGITGLTGEIGTAFTEAVKRQLAIAKEDTTAFRPSFVPVTPVTPIIEGMKQFFRAYEEGKKVRAPVPPTERIRRIQEGAGVDNLQGSVETKGDTVSLNFNAGELFAALIESPEVSERLSS